VKTKTRNALVFAGTGLVLATGLWLLAQHRKAPDLGGQALDAVPSGALLVARADLAALRASPVGAPFLREGRDIPGLGKVRDVCGFDPLDTLSEAVLAVPAAGDTGEFGLAASGPVDDDAVIACAAKVIEARGGRPVVTTMGSFRSVRDAALATAGGEIAVRKGGPLLLGAGTYLRSMIDAADGRAPSVRSSRAHAALAHEVEGASVRITVVLSPEQRRTLADELQAAGATGSPAGAIAGGALGVTMGPLVGLHGVISCDDAAASDKLAGSFEKARQDRAGDPFLRLVGLGAALERLTIKPAGELLHARVELPAEQAALLAEKLLALRSLRRAAPEEEPAAPRRRREPVDEVITPDGGARPPGSAARAGSAAPTGSAAPAGSAGKRPEPKR
jgi:hypothetical protein